VSKCVCVCEWVCVSVCVSLWMSVWVSVFECVWVCEYVFVSVLSVCVCVWIGGYANTGTWRWGRYRQISPITGPRFPEGSRKIRFPDFVTTVQDGGRLSALSTVQKEINSLNAELNPICHSLALLGSRHILHISRVRVNKQVTQYEIWVSPRDIRK